MVLQRIQPGLSPEPCPVIQLHGIVLCGFCCFLSRNGPFGRVCYLWTKFELLLLWSNLIKIWADLNLAHFEIPSQRSKVALKVRLQKILILYQWSVNCVQNKNCWTLLPVHRTNLWLVNTSRREDFLHQFDWHLLFRWFDGATEMWATEKSPISSVDGKHVSTWLLVKTNFKLRSSGSFWIGLGQW